MYIWPHLSTNTINHRATRLPLVERSEERADFYTLENIKTLPHMHNILLPRKSLGQNIDKSVRKCRGKKWRELSGPLLLPSQRPQHMATAAAVAAAKKLGWMNSQCPSALGSRAQSGRTHSSPHTLRQSKHRLTTRQHWKALHPFILVK